MAHTTIHVDVAQVSQPAVSRISQSASLPNFQAHKPVPAASRLGNPRYSRFGNLRYVSAALLLSLGILGSLAQPTNSIPPTVGMEGHVQIMLPGTMLEAKAVEPKAKLLLRVAEARPHGTLFDYDLRYIGLVPGKYDLRDFLKRKDGSSTNDLPTIPVETAGLLPQKHQGQLVAQEVRKIPFLGGYKTTLIALVIGWAILFVPLWRIGRKPKAVEAPKTEPKPPTLADRLRPLVAQAVEGKLSRDELALLERMLLNYWREKLALQGESMAEAMQKLRQHPEGGSLLREMENWLHRPPGSAKVDVNALLAPYQQATASTGETARAN